MRTARVLLGLVAVASIALTGCSKREDLKLAECKDRVITIHDFEDSYAQVKDEYLPTAEAEDEKKKEFLDMMLNREVLAAKADELGYDKDPAVAQGMEAFRRMTTQIAFLRREVGEIKVSDADVKKYYDMMGTTVSMKQILCDREEQAQEAYKALKDNPDFESVIMQYSKADDAKDGGTVITAPFGQLVPEVEEEVFKQSVGGVTEPIFTVQGWVILKVLKIDKVGRKSPAEFEAVKDRLREQIHNQREAIAVNAFTGKLRDQYGVVWNYDNLEIVFSALPPDRPLDQPQSRDQEVFPLLYFEAGDLDKPLVSYPGRTIAIKDFSDLYDQASFFNRPRREARPGGIRSFLTLNVMNDISNDVVKKSGIESDPEVKRILQLKQDEIMTGLLYEDVVNKQSVVTFDKMEAYYKDNQQRFRQPERRMFGVVVAGDVETAQRAQEELRSGKPVATIAAAYSTDEETLETRGVTKNVMRGELPEYDEIGFGLPRVGAVSDPFQVSRGWAVLKLMELSPERLFTYEEAQGQIDATLREGENDRRLKVLLAKWKDEYKVVIHDENLKKVKLPERKSPAETKKDKKDKKAAS